MVWLSDVYTWYGLGMCTHGVVYGCVHMVWSRDVYTWSVQDMGI